MAMMTVYHGGYQPVNQPEIRKGRNTKDFGRESKKDNDLFYTCSLIEYIARKTKNTRATVVNYLGKVRLEKIYDLSNSLKLFFYHFLICHSAIKAGKKIPAFLCCARQSEQVPLERGI